MHYILYNSNKTEYNSEIIKNLISNYEGMVRQISIFDVKSYKDFFLKINQKDDITIIGGDGTLSYFINDIIGLKLPCNVYFVGIGYANDFIKDKKSEIDELGRLKINDYLVELPTAFVNGIKKEFIVGVGFGIDGYTVNKLRELVTKKPHKKIKYLRIFLGGILHDYKRVNAEVIVDGVSYKYNKVYLASTMKGRFYGGGMLIDEEQSDDKKVSIIIWHNSSRLKALIKLPKLFKGEKIESNNVDIKRGQTIEVRFDKPTALQIDGEPILNVYSYQVTA